MNNKIISTVLLFTNLVTSSSYTQTKEFEYSKYASVEANRVGLFSKRIAKISFKGKNGWKINAAYPITVRLDDMTLKKNNAQYKDLVDDKASEVYFAVKSTSSYGNAKIVLCNESTCTNPLTVNFEIIER